MSDTQSVPAKVNVRAKLASFSEHWSPRIVGELNGQHVKVARLAGAFVWHRHEHEDELFLVVRGSLTIRFRGGEVTLAPGEFVIVPRGVEHQPVAGEVAAGEEAHVLLFEPAGTRNTGDVTERRTVERPERI